MKLAIVHLEGKALQWHTALMKSGSDMGAPSWTTFTKSLIDQFGAISDNPMTELMRLRQKTLVDAYHEEFDSIITRLKLFDDHILSYILGGLKKEIQMMVRMFQPTYLQHMFTLARTYEATNSSNSMAKFHRGVLGPTPLPISSSAPINVGPKPTRHLTLEFIAKCRAKGLYSFCDEPYSMEHNRVHKKLQLHVMEMEEPQISVNALIEVAGFRTMRITGYHKNDLYIFS